MVVIKPNPFLWMVAVLSSQAAEARQAAGPAYVEPAVAVPRPVDHPFSGVVELDVDATDIAHRIFSVHQRIPVSGEGTMTLL